MRRPLLEINYAFVGWRACAQEHVWGAANALHAFFALLTAKSLQVLEFFRIFVGVNENNNTICQK